MPASRKTAPSTEAPAVKTASTRKASQAGKTAQTGKVDKRRERGEASIQKIIDAAIDLIADEGLGSVTMQRIATQIQSSSALVVFHFRSKENLLQAVLKYLSDLYDTFWVSYVRDETKPPAARIIGAMDCAQEFARRHPKAVSVFLAFGSERKSMRLYREIAMPSDEVYMAEGRRLLDVIVAEGGYRNVDLDALNDSLNYLVYGAWFWDHLAPRRPKSNVLHDCAMMMLNQAFPRHFPLGSSKLGSDKKDGIQTAAPKRRSAAKARATR